MSEDVRAAPADDIGAPVRGKRTPWIPIGAAVLVVVLVLGGVGAWLLLQHKDQSRQIVLPFPGVREPYGVAVDTGGNVFVADANNTAGANNTDPADASTNRVLKLPAGSLPPPAPPPTTKLSRGGLIDNTQLSAEQSQQMRKAFADAKSTMSLDASGKPVRRYLTDPPVEYRQPDPTQPTEFTEKKKKFHWWWQKKDDQDDSNLTPSASAGTSQQTAAAPAVAN